MDKKLFNCSKIISLKAGRASKFKKNFLFKNCTIPTLGNKIRNPFTQSHPFKHLQIMSPKTNIFSKKIKKNKDSPFKIVARKNKRIRNNLSQNSKIIHSQIPIFLNQRKKIINNLKKD